jgi:transcriptional regulator with XRE-family HTH domain
LSELGQLLKKARLEQGISLEHLQETTKIRKRYLECIEEGDYKALPGNFYVRAFIKSYAEAVGLDPAEVLSLYRNVIPEMNPEVVSDNIAPKRTVTKRSDKWSRFATGVMLVSFFLLIVGLIYYFALRNHNENNQSVNGSDKLPLTDRIASNSPGQGTPGAAGTLEAKSATPTPPPATPELKFLSTEKGIDIYELTNAASLSLEMTLAGTDCWFQIDKLTPNGTVFSHEMIEQGNLAKLGSPRKWESDKPVYLNIGLPKAVELKVNGVILPLGEVSNPKRVQIQLAAQ